MDKFNKSIQQYYIKNINNLCKIMKKNFWFQLENNLMLKNKKQRNKNNKEKENIIWELQNFMFLILLYHLI